MTTQARDAPQFYLTAPTPCPYLPDRIERKVFTHLIGRRAYEMNNALSQSGFRRSQTIASSGLRWLQGLRVHSGAG